MRLSVLKVFLFVMLQAKGLSSFIPNKGPSGVRWTVRNLKSSISWIPRKWWKRKNVFYQLQSCVTRCHEEINWVDRKCTPTKAQPRGLECEVDVPPICGINDTPVVSTIYTGISSANVSIKLPSDGLYFCRFRKIQYKFYAMETKVWNGSDVCSKLPSITKSFEVVDTYEKTVFFHRNASCSQQRGGSYWVIESLKPETSYCLFGMYSFGYYLNEYKSEIAFHQLATTKDVTTLRGKSPPHSTLSRPLLAIFISITLAVVMAVSAYKIHKKWKKIYAYVHGDIPQPLKAISDDIERVASNEYNYTKEKMGSSSHFQLSVNVKEFAERIPQDCGKWISKSGERRSTFRETVLHQYAAPESCASSVDLEELLVINYEEDLNDSSIFYRQKDTEESISCHLQGSYKPKHHVYVEAVNTEWTEHQPAFANVVYFDKSNST